jgi:hypothetical protein
MNRKAMNTIQFLAILFMFSDHIGKHFYPNIILFQVIGRFGMLLWPYFVVFGYRHTSDVESYALRLLYIAVISQLPYYLVYGLSMNPVFSLLFGMLLITEIPIRFKVILYSLALYCSFYMGMDYYFYHMVLIFYYVHQRHLIFVICLSTIFFCMITSYYNIFLLFGLLILEIDKEFLPRLNKYLKYSVYPAHYSIIYILTHWVR